MTFDRKSWEKAQWIRIKADPKLLEKRYAHNREYMKTYRKNPSQQLRYTTWMKGYRQKLRVEVLAKYSGGIPKCKCCGELQVEFLTLDHIHGGGNKERRTLGLGVVFRQARDEVDLTKYQVLCMNCNWAKGKYGRCPHGLS